MHVPKDAREPTPQDSSSAASPPEGERVDAEGGADTISSPLRPPGDSGAWLQQFIWSLDDGDIRQARRFLEWLIEEGEPWALVQAGEIVVERLTQESAPSGKPAALIRCYHELGARFSSPHAVHDAFLAALSTYLEPPPSGSDAHKRVEAFGKSLNLHREALEAAEGYQTLQDKLRTLEQKLEEEARTRKEQRVERLLAQGELSEALFLCRQLIETYDSPVAREALPVIIEQARLLNLSLPGVSLETHRRNTHGVWEWPDVLGDEPAESSEASRDALYEPHRRPDRDDVDPPPPDERWSRAFEAPSLARETRTTADDSGPGDDQPENDASPDAFDTRGSAPVEASEKAPLEEVRPSSAREVADETKASGPGWRVLIPLAAAVFIVVLWFVGTRLSAPSAEEPEGKRGQASGEARREADMAPPSAPNTNAEERAPHRPSSLDGDAAPKGAHGPPGFLKLSLHPTERLEFYVDGRMILGDFSKRLELPSGEHRIEAFHQGYEPYSERIVIKEGEVLEKKIHLLPSPRLDIKAEPLPGMELRIDRIPVHMTPPIRGYIIDPGPHRIELSAPGRRTWRKEIEARAGDHLALSTTLEKLDSDP